MDNPPAYLILFLLRIRRHSGEPDYLEDRFSDMPMERMSREAYMLKELHRLGFIALSSTELEKVYDPLQEELSPGVIVYYARTETRVPYPKSLSLLPAGHYAVRELLFQGVGGIAWTFAVAMVGGFVGALIG